MVQSRAQAGWTRGAPGRNRLLLNQEQKAGLGQSPVAETRAFQSNREPCPKRAVKLTAAYCAQSTENHSAVQLISSAFRPSGVGQHWGEDGQTDPAPVSSLLGRSDCEELVLFSESGAEVTVGPGFMGRGDDF